ncbi:hypothetical protein PWG14_25120 [Chromobacterium amazonense]|uniref:phage baseplate assembly protein n=1 Tax=Chromobacterium amazonense TaxID=1382803 RepID=UPI00237ED2E8|nr:hypothetical protein [Chromobacterium amazonense]MDE1715752.1 hypothetical protein [Chromobacterium amazonense]
MDDLTLITNGRRVSGWTSINIVRGIERFPSGFQIGMTERFPGEFGRLLLYPGDPVQVLLGDDVVVTGYVDDFSPTLNATTHSVAVSGRGKCQDLVDCSHFFNGCQMSNVTPLSMAIQLATPYGIDVVSDVGAGESVLVWQLPWGETPYNILEPVARNSQMLIYENPDGSLRLSQAMRPAAGQRYPVVAEGVNIESITMRWSMSQRFSQYIGRSLPMDMMSDAGTGLDVVAVVSDPAVQRLRVRSIIAETGDTSDYQITRARVNWEAARRAGRSMQATVTVDHWRDDAGNLWQPNTLVTLTAPTVHVPSVNWLISDVTYRRDETGTHADLVLMPPEAFVVQPVNLFPTMRDVVAGAAKGNS